MITSININLAMEETLKRIQVPENHPPTVLFTPELQDNKGVSGVIVINNEGIPVKTTMVHF